MLFQKNNFESLVILTKNPARGEVFYKPAIDLGMPSPHEGSFYLRKAIASRFATVKF